MLIKQGRPPARERVSRIDTEMDEKLAKINAPGGSINPQVNSPEVIL